MRKLVMAAVSAAAIAFAAPAMAQADSAICHNGVLSDDAGQGCADGLYAQTYGGNASRGSGICYDGVLSNDAGMGCADGLYQRVYGSGARASRASSTQWSAPRRQYVKPTYNSNVGGTLQRIAQCESGGNPRAVNPNGHYGKYQFDLQTWASVGGSGNPINASEAEQDRRAQILYSQRGGQPWACAG